MMGTGGAQEGGGFKTQHQQSDMLAMLYDWLVGVGVKLFLGQAGVICGSASRS